MKKKHDYNIFTKAELIEFLENNENRFDLWDKPFEIIIEHKMDVLLEKKKMTSCSGTQTSETSVFEDVKDMLERHEKWSRLNKEYYKLFKIRFGE